MKFSLTVGTQCSTSPLTRSPEASNNQEGLVNIVHSVVHGRVESCGLFLIDHKKSLKHIGTTL